MKGGKENIHQATCGGSRINRVCPVLRLFAKPGLPTRRMGSWIHSVRGNRIRKSLRKACGKHAKVYETPPDAPEVKSPKSSGIEPSIWVRKSLVFLGEAVSSA